MPDVRTFAIAGASLAGISAAQTLRSEGFDGRIVLLGEEALPPYERPELSKAYLRGEATFEELVARTPEWFEATDVELRTGTRVDRLFPDERAFALADGSRVEFDRGLIATGASNRTLGVPGEGLPGVLALRTVAESDAIRRAAADGGPAVVVGMGFIGAEVAASLRRLGVDVTVVEVFETSLWKAIGPDAGRAVEALHREHDVTMRFGESVEAFEGVGRVQAVRTTEGVALPCAFVVVGVGVAPNTALWPLDLAPDGGIPVGPSLETDVPDVFAAGDVASHAHPSFGRLRVEHYDNAIKMGEAAARNMLGADAVFDDPHWFWSEQYDVRVEMVGVAPSEGTTILRGSYEDGAFCAFSLDTDGALRAATSLSWPRDVRRAIPLVRGSARPDPAQLADPSVDLRKLV